MEGIQDQRSERRGWIRSWFWRQQETPEGYIRLLRMVEPILQQTWLWSDERLEYRLGSLERLAFQKRDEWRQNEAVEKERHRYLTQLREAFGPRLKKLPDNDFRRRLNQFMGKVECHLGVPDPYCRPTRARIELTDACNLRCPMCPQSFWKWDRNYATEEILERSKSLLPWLTNLDLTSFGETLLSPLFRKTLEMAPSHAHVQLISNGLLIQDEMAEFLVSQNLSELHISIDSSSREVYQLVRGVDAFERVIENCRRLVRARNKTGKGKPDLVFNYTLSRKNFGDLIPLIRLAAGIGFDVVHINYLMVWVAEQRPDSVWWIREETCEMLEQAERVAGEVGVRFYHPPKPLKEHEGVERFETFCPEAWEFIHLRAMGRITVCCMSAEEYEFPSDLSWEQVWDSPAYQDFRRRVNLPGDQAPPLCRNCFFGRNVQPGDPRFHFFDQALSEHLTGEIKHPYGKNSPKR